MVLALVIISLTSSTIVALPYNTEGQLIDAINGKSGIKNTYYSYTEDSALKYVASFEPNSFAGYYFVQTQTGSVTHEGDSQNVSSLPNNTRDNQDPTDNMVTGDSSSNSITSPTESTRKDNLNRNSNNVKCEGSSLCVTGEVVKVINGKTFYVNIQNKIYEVELALIALPIQSEEAMRAATTFTRNACLGSNILIDQDDGQKVDSFTAQVYCSPTMHLNSLLLQSGYVQLDKSQCQASEFSKLDWAKSYGC